MSTKGTKSAKRARAPRHAAKAAIAGRAPEAQTPIQGMKLIRVNTGELNRGLVQLAKLIMAVGRTRDRLGEKAPAMDSAEMQPLMHMLEQISAALPLLMRMLFELLPSSREQREAFAQTLQEWAALTAASDRTACECPTCTAELLQSAPELLATPHPAQASTPDEASTARISVEAKVAMAQLILRAHATRDQINSTTSTVNDCLLIARIVHSAEGVDEDMRAFVVACGLSTDEIYMQWARRTLAMHNTDPTVFGGDSGADE